MLLDRRTKFTAVDFSVNADSTASLIKVKMSQKVTNKHKNTIFSSLNGTISKAIAHQIMKNGLFIVKISLLVFFCLAEVIIY